MQQRENLPKTFGESLRRAREAQGISQRALAVRIAKLTGLRLDPSAVTRIETDQREPKVIEAQAIAAALGMSLDDLVPPAPGNVLLHKLWMDHDDAKFDLFDAVYKYGFVRRQLLTALEDLPDTAEDYDKMLASARPRAIADWPEIRADILARTIDQNPPYDDSILDAET